MVELGCEAFGEAFLGQPVNAVTSLAFVAAGAAVLVTRRTGDRSGAYGTLVVAVGLGSLIQHGPHPGWQAYAHDLPLAAVLAFVAADAAADQTGRRRPVWWWLVPTAALVPLVALGPAASTLGQGMLATAAIGLSLMRARRRRGLRRTLLTALALLAAGALVGTLGDRTALCQPGSILQGHAVWHVLAAAALWWLAPAVGVVGRSRRAPAVAGTAR